MSDHFFSPELQSLYRDDNLPQVIARAEELLREQRANNGNRHVDIALALKDVARAYFKASRHEEAIQLTKEAMRIDLESHGAASPDYIIELCNLASAYRCQDHFSEAELALEHAMELVEQSPPNQQWPRSCVYTCWAKLHAARKEFSLAERRLLEAAKLRLSDENWRYSQIGRVYGLLGELYRTMGKELAAERSLRKALRYYEWDPHSEEVEYARLRAALGMDDKENATTEPANNE